ncbi:MAG: hypothetical protein P3T54_00280 [Dehalogenimonas sp.]|uniref:Uncharacterized protein n=1 Tax=Candidatus Dehalogenimonas loeffleri TaxID=3127115 RepID=A0ABZ2J1M8_9CHLR|nr:hypothetical protein [Dehalogenimonas sp.]
MIDLTSLRPGQTYKVNGIKGSPSFHKWCNRIGLVMDNEFEITRVIPVVLNPDDVNRPITWIEFLVNGHLIRLSPDEFRCLTVEPGSLPMMAFAGTRSSVSVA